MILSKENAIYFGWNFITQQEVFLKADLSGDLMRCWIEIIITPVRHNSKDDEPIKIRDF